MSSRASPDDVGAGGMRKRVQAGVRAGAAASGVGGDDKLAVKAARKPPPRWLPLLPAFFALFCFALLGLTYWRHVSLPPPRPLDAPLSQFSEARARAHLHALTGFGIRMAGSRANELHAVQYLLRTLADMQQELAARAAAEGPASAAAGIELQVELQRPSGTFDLDFLNGFTSSYLSVTNVIARLAPKGRPAHGDPVRADGAPARGAGASLLISGHFDSAPGTVAATDDIANCANMLEVLRALLHRPQGALDAAVVFLWNGAEETILQASHGFITQHRWAKDVAAFLNLEGAGGSGRELVFQTGPAHTWLAETYSRVAPYPFASILAQEIFQSGAIPSDTDFRIYRDFAHVPGIDIAYIDRGYIYHTALDRPEAVAQGAMQRCGDNLQATLQELANNPFLALTHRAYKQSCHAKPEPGSAVAALVEAHETARAAHENTPLSEADLRAVVDAHVCLDLTRDTEAKAIFFDVLGFFVLLYSSATSLRVNSAVLLLVATYLARQAWRRRSRNHKRSKQAASSAAVASGRSFPAQVGLTLLSVLCAILAPIIVGGVMSQLAPMSWFSHGYLVGGLFLVPSLLVFCEMQRRFFADVGQDTERRAAGAAEGEDEDGALDGEDAPMLPAAAANGSVSRLDYTQPAWLRAAFEREEAAYDASLAIWALLLLLLTVAQVGSSFLCLAFVIWPLLARSVARRVEVALHAATTPSRAKQIDAAALTNGKSNGSKGKAAAVALVAGENRFSGVSLPSQRDAPKGVIFLCAYLGGLALPSVLFLQAGLVVSQFFVPLTGRSGTVVPSDVFLAVIFGVLLASGGMMCLSVVQIVCNWRAARRVLLGVFVASVLFALAPQTGFPFTRDTPKRLYLVHLSREFHQPGHDSAGDVSHLLGAPVSLATTAAAGTKLSPGAELRALRSSVLADMPRRDAHAWLISMDYVNMAPLRSITLPAEVLGREAPAGAKINMFDGARVQACSANATDTRARLFCDLPYYLPLPSFVPGNVLLPIPEHKAPAAKMRPTLRLERVEDLSSSFSSPATAATGARRRRLHFVASSLASHMTLYLNNRAGFSRVRQWSFGDSVRRSAELGRDSLGEQYEAKQPDELFVYFASGIPMPMDSADDTASASTAAAGHTDARALLSLFPKELQGASDAEEAEFFLNLPREWRFWIEVADDVDEEGSSEGAPRPFVDLALAAHYFAREQNVLPVAMLPHMPSWLSPVFFTSFHHAFQF